MRSFLSLGAGLCAMSALPLLVASPVRAQEWCGFHTNTTSVVRCGYSSEAKCRDAMGSKDAVCIPDPTYVQDETTHHPGV